MSANEFGIDQDTISGFLDEAGMHIATLNERLLAVEHGSINNEGVAEMFGAAHSLKGAAGFLKLTDIASLTHRMESVLDLVRHGKMTFSTPVVDALFQSFDMVSSLMAEVAGGTSGNIDIKPALALLESVLAGTPTIDSSHASPPVAIIDPVPTPVAPSISASAAAAIEFSNPDSARSYDPVTTHLPALPEWIHGKLTEEDVCESLFAMGDGNCLVALLWEANALLHFPQGPKAALDALGPSLNVRRIIPIVTGPEDLWAPLREYQVSIGTFATCSGNIDEVLQSLDVPQGRAWILKPGAAATTEQNIGQDPAKPGKRQERLVIKSDMIKHRPLWIGTTRDTLAEMDAALLNMEKEPAEVAHIDRVFRYLHTLKGASASMGLDEMARLAHQGESLLAAVRDGRLRLDQDIMGHLFTCKDVLQTCTDLVDQGIETPPDTASLDAALTQRLSAAALQQQTLPMWAPSDHDLIAARAACGGHALWKLRVILAAHTPLPDLRYGMILTNLGRVAAIHTARPTLAELENGIENPKPLCVLFSSAAPLRELIDSISCDYIRDWSIDPMPAAAELVASGSSSQPQQASDQKSGHVAFAAAVDTVRVDTARLDHLLNTAGELAITKARLTQQVDSLMRILDGVDVRTLERLANRDGSSNSMRHVLAGIASLRRAQDVIHATRDTTLELHRHTSAMQRSVMQSRMVPIGPLFQRFHRLVRDLCKERGRDAKLVTVGDATELDKKLIDEIGDPLTHLIRNGIDHGMETPDERTQVGKSRQGTVQLEAYHQGSVICIKVTDDGRGLSVERIRNKAIERGLVTAEAAARMSNEDIYQFIFLPGFSTAAQVTNISGRGVGMDIVKSKVLALKGKIAISSDPEKGASFTISLPLTLAMIDSLLVKIGNDRFAFPLDSVREIVEIPQDEIRSVEGKGRVLFLRDQVISLLDLHHVVGINALNSTSDLVRAVITKGGSETLAIAVDQVIGDEEIVVKPIGHQFTKVRGLSGATVLGDGGIALILDIHGIHDLTHARHAAIQHAGT